MEVKKILLWFTSILLILLSKKPERIIPSIPLQNLHPIHHKNQNKRQSKATKRILTCLSVNRQSIKNKVTDITIIIIIIIITTTTTTIKAYASVDHKWPVEMMPVHRFPEWMGKMVSRLCATWKTRIVVTTKQGRETSELIKFNKGLPQGVV